MFFFCYFCRVNTTTIHIVTKSKELPQLDGSNFFHSPELFRMMEDTPATSPYMVIAKAADGTIQGHMLATLRRRGSWIPPYLFSQGRIYGEGVYADEQKKEELFSLMLHAITQCLHRRMCLYIEFSNVSKKMFGYRAFRSNGYFPVAWMNIHNSLHSMEPELRLEEKTIHQINKGYEAGITTRPAANAEEVHKFYRLLKAYYRFRPQRFIPQEHLFQELSKSPSGSIHITCYKNKIIGGTAVVYSHNDAFLWFETYRKKRYPLLNVDLQTIWYAIRHSFENGNNHIYFLHVGLPFSKSRYRDFILNFGGKPVSTFRWFHFTFGWINRLLAWIYSM